MRLLVLNVVFTSGILELVQPFRLHFCRDILAFYTSLLLLLLVPLFSVSFFFSILTLSPPHRP